MVVRRTDVGGGGKKSDRVIRTRGIEDNSDIPKKNPLFNNMSGVSKKIVVVKGE